jgi:hypothetical protein
MSAAPLYRPIPGHTAYRIGRDRDVWSVPKRVAAKAGSTRLVASRRLKPDDKDRVWLSDCGQKTRVHVSELFREVWPELVICRHGHPLALGGDIPTPPALARALEDLPRTQRERWLRTRQTLCEWCDADDYDDTYWRHHGIAKPLQNRT